MKKIISLVMAFAMVLCLGSFAAAEEGQYELALITDVGNIDDKSFNQGSWEGLVQYAEENSVTHKYYQPAEKSDDAYLDSIQLAVEAGAKLIVTPGFLFERPIYIAQEMYPDVYFVLIDGVPNDNGDFNTGDNTVGVLYAEEQSGFLAGYAAVLEGYTNLGFIGGMAVPAVIRFGYGFVQGVEYAVQELGLEEAAVNYHYAGVFWATPEVQALAASWYNDGMDVIFACGGGLGNSVMAAAEAAGDKWVVGVDIDQSAESEQVITSSAKSLRESVYKAIAAHYNGDSPGGETWVLGAESDGVNLPMETSRFSVFTQDDYDAIFAKLVAGEIELLKDEDVASAADIPLELTKVTIVN